MASMVCQRSSRSGIKTTTTRSTSRDALRAALLCWVFLLLNLSDFVVAHSTYYYNHPRAPRNDNDNDNNNNNNDLHPSSSSRHLQSAAFDDDPEYPHLSGNHFPITVIEQPGYVDIVEQHDGKLEFSGYLIDILEQISRPDRANFTYELRTPSGFGAGCDPRLTLTTTASSTTSSNAEAYHARYRTQYNCGEHDVNEPLVNTTTSSYTTDFYWGMYYITPTRLQANQFTVPYSPPVRATLTMMGAVTNIYGMEDALTNYSDTLHICAFAGTAYLTTLEASFPQVPFVGIWNRSLVYEHLQDGTCDVVISTYAELAKTVLDLSRKGQCYVDGKPIGIIGDPLDYGLNHFAFGIRNDLANTVLPALNFWLQALMACFPQDPDGFCPSTPNEKGGGGSLSELFAGQGGTGDECGYVQFPPSPPNRNGTRLSNGVLVALVIAPVVLVLALAMTYHVYRLKAQEKRMKKRFIQQLARNIDIGESAREIPADKLTKAFIHIGGNDGTICKQDLATWLNDLHMDFMSEKDFDRLWDAMDMDGSGSVDTLEFFYFLSECGPQFKEVHREYSALPKTERMKLATRRLSNIREHGEEEVEQMERRNNRRSRQLVNIDKVKLKDGSSYL